MLFLLAGIRKKEVVAWMKFKFLIDYGLSSLLYKELNLNYIVMVMV